MQASVPVESGMALELDVSFDDALDELTLGAFAFLVTFSFPRERWVFSLVFIVCE